MINGSNTNLIEAKMSSTKLIPLKGYRKFSSEVMINRSEKFYFFVKKRRTVRDFSDRPVACGSY